jgi:hypothetical protein
MMSCLKSVVGDGGYGHCGEEGRENVRMIEGYREIYKREPFVRHGMDRRQCGMGLKYEEKKRKELMELLNANPTTAVGVSI